MKTRTPSMSPVGRTVSREKMKSEGLPVVTAAVYELQTDDLRGFPSHPELVQGMTLRTHLVLAHTAERAPIAMQSIDDSRDTDAIRFNLKEFLDQPVPRSALTHAVGHVVRTKIVPRQATWYLGAGNSVEILLEADGVPFVVAAQSVGDVDIRVPGVGELMQVCGTMFFFPSFCGVTLLSSTTVRIRDLWKCEIHQKGKERIWGTVALEIDPSIKRPVHTVYNPYEMRK